MEFTFTSKWAGLHPDVRILDREGRQVYLLRGKRFVFLTRRYEMCDAEGRPLLTIQETFGVFDREFVVSQSGRLVCKAGIRRVTRYYGYVDRVSYPRLEVVFSRLSGWPKEIRADEETVGEIRWKGGWSSALAVTMRDEYCAPENLAGLGAIYVILTTEG